MISERKPEWAAKLSTELKSWIPTHGYTSSTELADELDIPRTVWNSIYQGYGIAESGRGKERFDGKVLYARLKLWTDLEEADPRNIPDRVKILPKGGIYKVSRRFTEAEFQNWLSSPEARELLAKRETRFKRETVSTATEEVAQPESTQTAGNLIGNFMDEMIRRGAIQIANIVTKRQAELVSEQFRGLESRIDTLALVVTNLTIQTQREQQIRPQPRHSRANQSDIGQMASRLRDLLEAYRTGTSQDRDTLMRTYGQELFDLDILVHTLTRRSDEREESIKLTKEVKL